MPEISTTATKQPLAVLLQAEKDYPSYALDICTGYISTNGILPLKTLLKSSPKVRAVVGLNRTNRLSALQMLYHDYGVELYVYVTAIGRLFHPKIYLGTRNSQAWTMIGSSNLTYNGLSGNVEENVFVTGQRHIEPFVSIEAQINAFQQQAYLFNIEIERKLQKIEQELGQYPQERAYKNLLFTHGIRPKVTVERVIPVEAQEVALDSLFTFVTNTYLEYAYQMLLLLAILDKADEQGLVSVDKVARYFIEFYKRRREAGLPGEKLYGSKRAIMDDPNVSVARVRQMLKTSPFPRFERQGLLDLSEDGKYFMVNPALITSFTYPVKQELRNLAQERLKIHFKS